MEIVLQLEVGLVSLVARVILGSSHHGANQILADNANGIKSKLLRMHLVPAITK